MPKLATIVLTMASAYAILASVSAMPLNTTPTDNTLEARTLKICAAFNSYAWNGRFKVRYGSAIDSNGGNYKMFYVENFEDCMNRYENSVLEIGANM